MSSVGSLGKGGKGGKTASLGFVLMGAILAGAFGPRLTWPSSVDAGAPFVYTPPPGFVPADDPTWKAIQAASPAIRQGWYVPTNAVETTRPTVNVMHAPRMEPVETSDLDALAASMPDVVARSGSTWKTVRIIRETRRDGARVGWIEGENDKDGLKYRSLELVFPDDDGTSFVTAMIPFDQMDKWSPLFEASVQSATGVAKRFGPPPSWMHVAWAAGGALLALLAGGIVQRRERRRAHASAPPPPLEPSPSPPPSSASPETSETPETPLPSSATAPLSVAASPSIPPSIPAPLYESPDAGEP